MSKETKPDTLHIFLISAQAAACCNTSHVILVFVTHTVSVAASFLSDWDQKELLAIHEEQVPVVTSQWSMEQQMAAQSSETSR
jgi:hypothetical protein